MPRLVNEDTLRENLKKIDPDFNDPESMHIIKAGRLVDERNYYNFCNEKGPLFSVSKKYVEERGCRERGTVCCLVEYRSNEKRKIELVPLDTKIY